MRQVTLTALYGKKPEALAKLITQGQNAIAEIPGLQFSPYDLGQVHATIVAFSKVIGSPMHNLNFAKFRNQLVTMDVCGFLESLKISDKIPFSIQIGGFQNCDYPFSSRGQRPYHRSFSIQGNKAVMMGWPICGQPPYTDSTKPLNLVKQTQIYPNSLEDIRNTAQAFNILHTYHRTSTDVDNDFYFRIGLLNSDTLNEATQTRLEEIVREFLCKTEPIIVNISLANLAIAVFEDETLPLSSTKIWSLQDTKLTPELPCSFYS